MDPVVMIKAPTTNENAYFFYVFLPIIHTKTPENTDENSVEVELKMLSF